jgi:hypothetical protein
MDLLRSAYDAACTFILQQNVSDAISAGTRWVHILSAGAWFGMSALAALVYRQEDPAPPASILQRSFLVYKWSAMLAFLSGLNLLHIYYRFPVKNYFDGDRGLWIISASLVAFIMWGHTWFHMPPLVRKACQGSQEAWLKLLLTNRLLSWLLTFVALGMVSSSHPISLLGKGWGGWILGSSAVLGLSWICWKKSTRK